MQDVTARGAQTAIFTGYNAQQAKAVVEQIAKMQAWAWQNEDRWHIAQFNVRVEELFGNMQSFVDNMVGVNTKHPMPKRRLVQVLHMARHRLRCTGFRR
mgnify:CR=1 FL=1